MQNNFSNHYYTVMMSTYHIDKLVFSNWTQFKFYEIYDLSPEDAKAYGRTNRVILLSKGPATHEDREYLASILGGEQYIKTGIFVG